MAIKSHYLVETESYFSTSENLLKFETFLKH